MTETLLRDTTAALSHIRKGLASIEAAVLALEEALEQHLPSSNTASDGLVGKQVICIHEHLYMEIDETYTVIEEETYSLTIQLPGGTEADVPKHHCKPVHS